MQLPYGSQSGYRRPGRSLGVGAAGVRQRRWL